MKSFILHLPSIPASLASATKLKNDLENFGMEAELFEGVRGDDAVIYMEENDIKLHHLGLKGAFNPDSRAARKYGRPGVKGCFLGHKALWQKCIDLDEPIIIWEDDIILTRPYIPVDWEEVLIVAIGHPSKSPRFMHLLETPTGEPEAVKYKMATMPGCCGYAIKPEAAKKLVNIYDKTYLAADNAIHRRYIKMQIHNHLMGIAKVDGKESLTRSKIWNQNKF